MTRTRAPYEPSKTVLDFPSPIEYVKNVLDSKSPEYKGGYETDGHVLLSSRYSNLKDEKQKKLIAEAITLLLDDPDYSYDAIPVAAELGLPEAKEWFLELSEKLIEEMREIKTSEYTNCLYCILNYFEKTKDDNFLDFTEKVLNQSKDKLEILRVLSVLAEVRPELSLELDKLPKYLPVIMESENEKERMTTLTIATSGIFRNYGDDYCINLAKLFKSTLLKNYHVSYYKALERNTKLRFKPYLEELKKILDITE